MNSLHLIERLLEETTGNQFNEDVKNILDELSQKSRMGAFDCLIEHPGTKPPDTRRNVQVRCTQYQGWITAFCEYTGVWLTVPGLFSTGEVLVWRELPPMPEGSK